MSGYKETLSISSYFTFEQTKILVANSKCEISNIDKKKLKIGLV